MKDQNTPTMIDARRKRLTKDSRGVPILPGVHVAYNRSGDVISGIVDHVTPGGEIHIKCDEDFDRNRANLSKVKRGTSCLVLGDPEGQELASSYASSIDSFRQSLADDVAQTKKQMEAEFAARERKLAEAYTAFLKDLQNAWDVDEMKMLAEHHFGDVIE